MAMMENFLSGIHTPSFVRRDVTEPNLQLSQDAATGVTLIKKLAETQQSGLAAAVKSAQAVAVVVQTKAGVGLALQFGSGYVVSRLGPGQWSPPSYFTIRNVSAGLTLGFEKVETVLCIGDQTALDKFTEGELALGTDVACSLRIDAHPGSAGTQHVNLKAEKEAAVTGFSVADGVVIDVSLKGGAMYTDAATNQALFGEAATPAALLKGQAQAPAEFAPLYELLNQISAGSA